MGSVFICSTGRYTGPASRRQACKGLADGNNALKLFLQLPQKSSVMSRRQSRNPEPTPHMEVFFSPTQLSAKAVQLQMLSPRPSSLTCIGREGGFHLAPLCWDQLAPGGTPAQLGVRVVHQAACRSFSGIRPGPNPLCSARLSWVSSLEICGVSGLWEPISDTSQQCLI